MSFKLIVSSVLALCLNNSGAVATILSCDVNTENGLQVNDIINTDGARLTTTKKEYIYRRAFPDGSIVDQIINRDTGYTIVHSERTWPDGRTFESNSSGRCVDVTLKHRLGE